MRLSRALAFRLVSAHQAQLAGFYTALGFQVKDQQAIGAQELALLQLRGTGRRLSLSLGASVLDLDSFTIPGEPYPAEATAADLLFQHLALVTDDVEAAWTRAKEAGAKLISREGPVQLPSSAGGVRAVKFRDPEGHPLELLQFPQGARPDWRGEGILGIDHSAISVADTDVSCRFYASLGLRRAGGSLNHGPSQATLDGLNDVEVHVSALQPPTHTPHLELLGYRTPRGRSHAALRANDVAATRVVWRADRPGIIRDPDGHMHQFSSK